MISFFLLSLPIFAVIGVGWAATRTRLVSQAALDALNAFSFRFALPALLLRLIAGQPLRQSFYAALYIGCLASGAIIAGTDLRTFGVISLWRKFGGTPRMRSHISVHRATTKYFSNSFVFKTEIEKEGLPGDITPALGAGGPRFKSGRPDQ